MGSYLPYHEVDGKRYPRVTRILSILRDPDLEAWQMRVGDKAAKVRVRHAERVGTELDRLIKQEVAGALVKLPKKASAEVRGGWKAWQEFKQEQPHLLNGLQVGQVRVNPAFHFAGEPDLVKPDEVWDIKATTHLRAKHWIQVNSYVPLEWPDPGHWEDTTLRLIRLDTFLGTYEMQERPFSLEMWRVFLNLKEVYVGWYAQEMDVHTGGTDASSHRKSALSLAD